MATYITRRLLQSLFVIWGVITAVFIITNLTGDPVDLMLGETSSQEDIERLRADLGHGRAGGEVDHQGIQERLERLAGHDLVAVGVVGHRRRELRSRSPPRSKFPCSMETRRLSTTGWARAFE